MDKQSIKKTLSTLDDQVGQACATNPMLIAGGGGFLIGLTSASLISSTVVAACVATPLSVALGVAVVLKGEKWKKEFNAKVTEQVMGNPANLQNFLNLQASLKNNQK